MARYTDQIAERTRKRQGRTDTAHIDPTTGLTNFAKEARAKAAQTPDGIPGPVNRSSTNIPAGYQMTPGGLKPIPGGSADPNRDTTIPYNDVKKPVVSGIAGGSQDAPNPVQGFDANYVPKSEDEITSNPYLTERQRQRYHANLLAQQPGVNLDPNNIPSTFEEEAADLFADMDEEKTELDRQLDYAKEKADRRFKEDTGAVENQMAQGREGVVSEGNLRAAGEIKGVMEKEYDDQRFRIDSQKKQIANLRKQQERNFVASRADEIRAAEAAVAQAEADLEQSQNQRRQDTMGMLKMLTDTGALAGLDADSLAYLEEGLPGVPGGVVQALAGAVTRKDATEKQKAQMDGLTTLFNIAKEGGQLSPMAVIAQAQALGIDPQTLMQYNQVAASKNLEDIARAKSLELKMQAEQRGEWTNEARDIAHIKELRRNGDIASAELLERSLGIDDLGYQAELALKQAQAKVQQNIANGVINNPLDLIDLAQKTYDYYESIGYNPSVIPEGGKYGAVSYTTPDGISGIRFNVENGKNYDDPSTDRDESQCGAFVNDITGIGMGDGFDKGPGNKMSFVDKSIRAPAAGMIYVQQIQGNWAKYGHTGMVEYFNPATSMVGVVSANAKGNGKIIREEIPLSEILNGGGFAMPPKSKSVANDVDKKTQEYVDKGVNRKDAKAKAEKEVLEGETSDYEIRQLRKEVYSIPVVKTFDQYNQQYNVMQTTYDSYKNGTVGANVADQALGVLFQKMLDPGSVVREGEFARTSSGQDVITAVTSYLDKLATGGQGINDKTREDMVQIGKEFMEATKSKFNREIQFYVDESDRLGIDPERMVGSYYQYYSGEKEGGGVIDSYEDYSIPEENPNYITSDQL